MLVTRWLLRLRQTTLTIRPHDPRMQCWMYTGFTSQLLWGHRRFISVDLVASPVATVPNLPPGTLAMAPGRFRPEPESDCSPGINLASDWLILSLLIGADAGSGPQTEDAIDLAPGVSFVAQNLLHFPDFVLDDEGCNFFLVGVRSCCALREGLTSQSLEV